MPSEVRQKNLEGKEIAINCSINNNFSHHFKKKHILRGKKALKTLFQEKNYPSEKKHKETLLFLKTLAGRTANLSLTRSVETYTSVRQTYHRNSRSKQDTSYHSKTYCSIRHIESNSVLSQFKAEIQEFITKYDSY